MYTWSNKNLMSSRTEFKNSLSFFSFSNFSISFTNTPAAISFLIFLSSFIFFHHLFTLPKNLLQGFISTLDTKLYQNTQDAVNNDSENCEISNKINRQCRALLWKPYATVLPGCKRDVIKVWSWYCYVVGVKLVLHQKSKDVYFLTSFK